ncbi:MAG: phosphotransferase [bacterium]|nr:phosphotransferase [bacterium]
MAKLQLFSPNNHSRHEINWKPIAPELEAELRIFIASHYAFGAVPPILQVDEWERMSNNFRIRPSNSAGYPGALFRKHIQLKTKEIIVLLNNVREFLGSEGVPVSKVLLTKDNQTTFREGEHFYEMYEFIAGYHFRGAEKELQEAARGIAMLHQALARIPFAEEILKNPPLLSSWNRNGWEYILTSAKMKQEEIDVTLNQQRGLVLQAIDAVERNSEAISRAKQQFIHCDLHPHNTIFRDGTLKALLDFEGVRMGELARDVANACHRFVRQFVVFHGGDWQDPLRRGLELFLAEYTKHNSLGREELVLLPVFIQDELLRKLFKDLNLYYREGYARNVEGGELKKKLTLLQEAIAIGETRL